MNKYLPLCLILPVMLNFLLCKQTVRDSATLTDSNTPGNKQEIRSSDTCCDTVILGKDSAVIDLKEAETAPEILGAARPVYSMDMIDNEVQGTVKLKLLIGMDGLVKKYIIFNDLGHGTNKTIHSAILKMKFTAARKNKKRVSVWIETTLHFNLPKI